MTWPSAVPWRSLMVTPLNNFLLSEMPWRLGTMTNCQLEARPGISSVQTLKPCKASWTPKCDAFTRSMDMSSEYPTRYHHHNRPLWRKEVHHQHQTQYPESQPGCQGKQNHQSLQETAGMFGTSSSVRSRSLQRTHTLRYHQVVPWFRWGASSWRPHLCGILQSPLVPHVKWMSCSKRRSANREPTSVQHRCYGPIRPTSLPCTTWLMQHCWHQQCQHAVIQCHELQGIPLESGIGGNPLCSGGIHQLWQKLTFPVACCNPIHDWQLAKHQSASHQRNRAAGMTHHCPHAGWHKGHANPSRHGDCYCHPPCGTAMGGWKSACRLTGKSNVWHYPLWPNGNCLPVGGALRSSCKRNQFMSSWINDPSPPSWRKSCASSHERSRKHRLQEQTLSSFL